MLVPGLFVWNQFVTVPADATEVEVIAQQWQWSYRLPGADGKLGTSDSHLVSPENPLGVNPDDPNGQDDVVVEAADLHLPMDKPVKMLLRSIDVLHDFYVPEFRAKMDMIPGSVTYFWFTPTRTGTFEVLCAELCGTGHGFMRGIVMIDTAEDYATWLGEQVDIRAIVGARAGRRGRTDGGAALNGEAAAVRAGDFRAAGPEEAAGLAGRNKEANRWSMSHLAPLT